jgi:DNA polymerase-3 subunit delta'
MAHVSFDGIAGQASALKVLTHALESGRLAQAYLFAGPDGVGKQKAALALAQATLCPSGPNGSTDLNGPNAVDHASSCDVCSRIAGGLHPDVRVFAPRDEGDRNLQVEYLRNEVLPLTKFAPFEGRAAFFIFPEADLSFPPHHAEAANALLKTLEEPRPAICFVLLSARADRLLATIRSRCQRVRFGALSHAVLDPILATHDVPQDARAAAIALASGSASRALELAAEGRAANLLELALRIHGVLGAAGSERDAGAALELAEELSRRDDRQLVLETLAFFYRDVAGSALGLAEDELRFRHQEVASTAATLSASAAAGRVAAISQLFDELRRNANAQIAFDGFMLGVP